MLYWSAWLYCVVLYWGCIVLYCGCALLYSGCTVLYCCCVVLYGDGTWLNYDTVCPAIISACTLYASDVLSHIISIVLHFLSLWPTDLQMVQYELFGTIWYFCIIDQWYGSWLGFLQILHHIPLGGNEFGIHAAIYCVNVGHSFLWCPSILHVVHQKSSHLSLLLF